MTGAGTGCQSDPAEDRPTTLGSKSAIAWTWACEGTYHARINAIHDGLRLRLQVNVPSGSEASAGPLLEQMRQGFTFTSGSGTETAASPDLATIDAELQGTYENAWHPVELEFATVEAAGLGGQLPRDSWDRADPATTVRWAVKFEGDTLTLYWAGDGGPYENAWPGRYRLLDANTIEATEPSTFNQIVYDFALRDGILTMDVVSNDDPVDLVPQTGIYETLPLTRVP
jgi:hypothetical protein